MRGASSPSTVRSASRHMSPARRGTVPALPAATARFTSTEKQSLQRSSSVQTLAALALLPAQSSASKSVGWGGAYASPPTVPLLPRALPPSSPTCQSLQSTRSLRSENARARLSEGGRGSVAGRAAGGADDTRRSREPLCRPAPPPPFDSPNQNF
jgi:hypothetical protein